MKKFQSYLNLFSEQTNLSYKSFKQQYCVNQGCFIYSLDTHETDNPDMSSYFLWQSLFFLL